MPVLLFKRSNNCWIKRTTRSFIRDRLITQHSDAQIKTAVALNSGNSFTVNLLLALNNLKWCIQYACRTSWCAYSHCRSDICFALSQAFFEGIKEKFWMNVFASVISMVAILHRWYRKPSISRRPRRNRPESAGVFADGSFIFAQRYAWKNGKNLKSMRKKMSWDAWIYWIRWWR